MTDFLLETMHTGRQYSIFKILKENKIFNPEFYASKNIFHKWMQNRDFYRHTEAEIIHHQQTHTTRNVKRNLLGGKKMIPDEHMDIQKGMKNIGSGNFISKCIIF